MSPIKEKDDRIIHLFPTWVRVLGGICFIGVAGFSYALLVFGIVDRNIVSSILFACAAFGFFLGGVYCCKTTEVTFDHTARRISIRKGLGSFRWGTRYISKEEVEMVTVEDAAKLAWGWLIYQSGEEAVSLGIKGKKKRINIITMDGDSSSRLSYRIREFVGLK